jgi:hypothetical protein
MTSATFCIMTNFHGETSKPDERRDERCSENGPLTGASVATAGMPSPRLSAAEATGGAGHHHRTIEGRKFALLELLE